MKLNDQHLQWKVHGNKNVGRPGALLCAFMRIVQFSHCGTRFQQDKALGGAADSLSFAGRVWSDVIPC